jgi:hypothetical protein
VAVAWFSGTSTAETMGFTIITYKNQQWFPVDLYDSWFIVGFMIG